MANLGEPFLGDVGSSDPTSNGNRNEEHYVAMIGGAENPSMACGDGCGLSDPSKAQERSAATRKLSIAVGFCLVFMVVEVAGGFVAHSLAIMTDAAHLLSDVAGFAISLFAIYASGWDATPQQSYGFHRLEILGALVSIQIIWLLTGILIYEAIVRIIHGTTNVNGMLMFVIATLGLVVNIVMMWLLGHEHGGHSHSHEHSHSGRGHGHGHGEHDETHSHSHSSHNHDDEGHEHHEDEGKTACKCSSYNLRVDSSKYEDHVEVKELVKRNSKQNINVRAAYLHVLGDLVQSIGVMIGGAVIWYKPELKIVDLICTLFFSVVVLATTIKMLRDIWGVLMENTPREIDATRLETGLREIPSVVAVHELHIWAITVGKVLLACHVRIEPNADADEVLRKVIQFCERDFKISHVTVQIERDLPVV